MPMTFSVRITRFGRSVCASLGCAALLLMPGPLAGGSAPRAGLDQDELRALIAADVRVQAIMHRLATANAALCRDTMGATGIVPLVARDFASATRPVIERILGRSRGPMVAGVVPGGPADRAGVQAGDVLVSVDGAPLAARSAPAAQRALDRPWTGGRPLAIGIERAGQARTISLAPAAACRAHVELKTDDRYIAATDGDVVILSTHAVNLLQRDDFISVVLAHELSHTALLHPERLTAARIPEVAKIRSKKRRQIVLQTEIEADRMSVYLVANAGWDPAVAATFWKWFGTLREGSLLSAANLKPSERIDLLNHESLVVQSIAKRPVMPPWLAIRDRPIVD